MITINLEALDKAVFIQRDKADVTDVEVHKDKDGNIEKTIEKTFTSNLELNPMRYEILTEMVRALMGYLEESDPMLGVDYAIDKAPTTIKLAYETLLKYNIINLD